MCWASNMAPSSMVGASARSCLLAFDTIPTRSMLSPDMHILRLPYQQGSEHKLGSAHKKHLQEIWKAEKGRNCFPLAAEAGDRKVCGPKFWMAG